jgi:transcriptional regulator with XRE-family HTH domain
MHIVKKLREQAKISQENLAGYLGICEGELAAIEDGARNLTTDLLEKCEVLFDVEVAEILDDSANFNLPSTYENFSVPELCGVGALVRIGRNLRLMELTSPNIYVNL